MSPGATTREHHNSSSEHFLLEPEHLPQLRQEREGSRGDDGHDSGEERIPLQSIKNPWLRSTLALASSPDHSCQIPRCTSLPVVWASISVCTGFGLRQSFRCGSLQLHLVPGRCWQVLLVLWSKQVRQLVIFIIIISRKAHLPNSTFFGNVSRWTIFHVHIPKTTLL